MSSDYVDVIHKYNVSETKNFKYITTVTEYRMVLRNHVYQTVSSLVGII